MADKLRNEVDIEIGGEKRVMRATFVAIRRIEAELGNIVPLIEKLGQADMGVNQAAVIIHHGLQAGPQGGFKTMEEVGNAIMEVGLAEVMEPVVKFLSCAMQGVSVGKSQAAE